tara:strand:+ start:3491 stop:4804 length:1314 start_codon:yes stop_codon:yes gene_type:complete
MNRRQQINSYNPNKAFDILIFVGTLLAPSIIGLSLYFLNIFKYPRFLSIGFIIAIFTFFITSIIFYTTFKSGLSKVLSNPQFRPSKYSRRSFLILSFLAIFNFSQLLLMIQMSGGSSLYQSSVVLQEARSMLMESLRSAFPGFRRIYSITSAFLIIAPLYGVYHFRVLSGKEKILLYFCISLYPATALAYMGRLYAGYMVLLLFISICTLKINTVNFRSTLKKIYVLIIVSFALLFAYGAFRQFSGIGARSDRSQIVEKYTMELNSPYDDILGPVLTTLPGQTFYQSVNYLTRPWYNASVVLANNNFDPQPFTLNFYFLSWPITKLSDQYGNYKERLYRVQKFRLDNDLPSRTWCTAFHSLQMDFGIIFILPFSCIIAYLSAAALTKGLANHWLFILGVTMTLYIPTMFAFSPFNQNSVQFSVAISGLLLLAQNKSR